jgi:hypothetical protein
MLAVFETLPAAEREEASDVPSIVGSERHTCLL